MNTLSLKMPLRPGITVAMMPTYRIKQAAHLLGISHDTLRRWANSGRIITTTDASGRTAVEGAALARLAQDLAELAIDKQGTMVVADSMRNRFPGLITRVVRDTVMAQVEIQAGPHRFVSLLSREAADELGLEPGMLAIAAVKATSVSVEIPADGPGRPTGGARPSLLAGAARARRPSALPNLAVLDQARGSLQRRRMHAPRDAPE